MLVVDFELDDLARIRFAVSPMAETVFALRLWRHPDRAGPHVPWLRRAIADLAAAGIDLEPAWLVVPTTGYLPDFLTPPATSPVARFEDELALVRSTPSTVVRREIEHAYRGRRRPQAVTDLIAHPRRAIRRIADALDGFWHVALEPHWSRVRALLDADLAHRARRLTAGGAAAVLADLHPQVRWREDRLEVATAFESRVALDGRGLLLVPTAFFWHGIAPIVYPPWQPTLIYPAHGLELLWDTPAPRSDALARVLGRSRSAMLAELAVPRSTAGLAARLGLSAPAVSQHLSALRGAGLVTSSRSGREVLYLRTELGERLVGPPNRSSPSHVPLGRPRDVVPRRGIERAC
jgi:DNA-binding transcriptional ArsR family regulator